MATQRQFYQPTASLPISMPSKAPGSVNYYPVGRVAVSPPDLSESSTTRAIAIPFAPFRAVSMAAPTAIYESNLPGVDVVDMLNDRMNNAFDPTPLDKGLVKQAQS